METIKKKMTSPKGSALWCQNVIEPSYQFDEMGTYEAKITMQEDDPKCQDFIKQLDELAQEGYEIETKELKPGVKKNVTLYAPYSYEEDDEGNQTGRVIFKSKCKAAYKTKDGTVKPINVPVFSMVSRKPIDTEGIFIGNGSEVRFSANAMSFLSNGKSKEAGVTLRLIGFQIVELADSGNDAESMGFDVAEEEEAPFPTSEPTGDF